MTVLISIIPNMVIREKDVIIFINKPKTVNVTVHSYRHTIKAQVCQI